MFAPRIFRLAVAACSTSACYLPVLVRVPMTGTVVDDPTGTPIAGATVCVETWQVGDLPGPVRPIELADAILVTTDEQGRFAVEPMRRFHSRSRYWDAGPAWLPRLVVSARDHRIVVLEGWRRNPYGQHLATDPIRLDPGMEPHDQPRCPTAATVDELPESSRARGQW
jgi:hypothetical protein